MTKRLSIVLLAFLMVLTLTSCITIPAKAEDPYQSPIPYEEQRIQMIATVEPSVVVVLTDTGHGSGIIYKSEAIENSDLILYYVITNHHVVEDGGEMRIYYGIEDEEIPVIDYVSFAPYDIAVVRFASTMAFRVHDVPPINQDLPVEILVGQDVYAIGTPEDILKFNYVTQGIISMKSYPYDGNEDLAIMHDAELNPGNSGGPLFNLNGELIGINVAKVPQVSTSDGIIAAEGLNYSLNINKIAPIIRGFREIDYQKVERRPRLGITVQDVEIFLQENSASLLPENPVGVVVIDLDPTRNAIDVIEVYDLIIAMNGQPIAMITDIATQLENAAFGDSHQLTVLRNINGTFVELTFTIILS